MILKNGRLACVIIYTMMFPDTLGFCSKLKRMIAQEDFISYYVCCPPVLFDCGFFFVYNMATLISIEYH